VRVIVLMVLTPPADELVTSPAPGGDRADGFTTGGGGAATATVTAARTETRPETRTETRSVARTVVTVVGSRGPAAVAVAVCAIGTLLLGVLPAWVLDLAAQAAKFGQ
jgi:NADH-quinone oxidoreductase subunit N